MTSDDYIYPANKKTACSKWLTVKDNAPTIAYLRAYVYQWRDNPLWLTGLPGIPDARKHPEKAIERAIQLLQADYNHRQGMLNAIA